MENDMIINWEGHIIGSNHDLFLRNNPNICPVRLGKAMKNCRAGLQAKILAVRSWTGVL
jgi:hypothetical protein